MRYFRTILGESEKRAVDDFVARVRERFGARVLETTLFGSRARGEARPDSDVDIAVVIRDTFNPTIAGLQRSRELADYDAAVKFSHADATAELANAEACVAALRELLVREGWLSPSG